MSLPAPPAGGARTRRLGVLGSFVWDEIHGREPSAPVVEEWGGITYALGAVDAALPAGWAMVPIAKVGEDLAPRAREFLRTLTRLAPDAAPVVVPQPNNRVVLRYVDAERRTETLRGGVPPWTWVGLAPLLHGLAALYVNLISGFELDLDTFRLVRLHFKRPIYTDLHSLVLAVQPDGARTWRPLPDVAQWCACTDFLQVNEDELAMLAPDGLALAATAHAQGVRALLVTLGARGAAWFATRCQVDRWCRHGSTPSRSLTVRRIQRVAGTYGGPRCFLPCSAATRSMPPCGPPTGRRRETSAIAARRGSPTISAES